MSETLRVAIASELELDPSDLTRDKLLSDIEAWDSVMVLIVSVMISDVAGVIVTQGEMKNLSTYGDIENLIMSNKVNSTDTA